MLLDLSTASLEIVRNAAVSCPCGIPNHCERWRFGRRANPALLRWLASCCRCCFHRRRGAFLRSLGGPAPPPLVLSFRGRYATPQLELFTRAIVWELFCVDAPELQSPLQESVLVQSGQEFIIVGIDLRNVNAHGDCTVSVAAKALVARSCGGVGSVEVVLAVPSFGARFFELIPEREVPAPIRISTVGKCWEPR